MDKSLGKISLYNKFTNLLPYFWTLYFISYYDKYAACWEKEKNVLAKNVLAKLDLVFLGTIWSCRKVMEQ